MSELTELTDRNRGFAATYEGDTGIVPKFSTIVLTCLDARVDPAHFLGLKPGEALVMRNAGGRVTRDVELDIGILWTLGAKLMGDKFNGMELAIVQHADCGLERLAIPELQVGLSQRLGVDQSEIGDLANGDHVASISSDIEKLRASDLVPQELVVSGHLYDVGNGRVRELFPPCWLRSKDDCAVSASA